MPIRVILADDATVVLRTARRLFDYPGAEDLHVVGEAHSFATLLQMVESAKPDVAVFDLFMVIRCGVPGAAALVAQCPCARVAISFATNDEAGQLATSVNAFRLLDKTTLYQTLLPTIREAATSAPRRPQPPTALPT